MAVFLDRDGVLNRNPPLGDYIKSWDEFELLPGVPEAIARLNRAGIKVFVITNQSGVGKGIYTAEALSQIHRGLRDALGEWDAKVDGIYHCPHRPDEGCDCRKPEIGMIKRAAEENTIDLETSYFVGDTEKDLAAGKAAGCTTIAVLTGRIGNEVSLEGLAQAPDRIFKNLGEAVDFIILEKRKQNSEKQD